MASRYSKLFLAALLTTSAGVASAGDRNDAGSVLSGYAGSRQPVSASIAAARSSGKVVVASEAAPTKPSRRMPSSTDEARGIGNAPASKQHVSGASACGCVHG